MIKKREEIIYIWIDIYLYVGECNIYTSVASYVFNKYCHPQHNTQKHTHKKKNETLSPSLLFLPLSQNNRSSRTQISSTSSATIIWLIPSKLRDIAPPPTHPTRHIPTRVARDSKAAGRLMNRAHYASVDKVVHAFRRSNVDNYKSNSVRKGGTQRPRG